jgi:hypothetical protein
VQAARQRAVVPSWVPLAPVLPEPQALPLAEQQERVRQVLRLAQHWARAQPEELPEQVASVQPWAQARPQQEPMLPEPAPQARVDSPLPVRERQVSEQPRASALVAAPPEPQQALLRPAKRGELFPLPQP